jgi:imidazolonepropionase-like amidohydrolase
MTTAQAVLAGFDEIQNVNMLFLNFLAGPGVDTRTPARFTAVADHAAELDLDSAPVSEFLDLLAQHGTVIDPTVAIFEDMFTQAPGQVAPSLAAVAGRLPPGLRRQLLAPRLNDSAAQAAARSDDFQAQLSMIGLLYQRGIPLVAGTDAMPGFTLHRELELYVRAGIPDAEVLRLATLGAASAMGVAEDTGSIEVGKRADLLLLDADPLKDISAVRQGRLVISGRRAWEPARLYRAVGVQP